MSFSYLLLDYEEGTPPISTYRSIGQMVNDILNRRKKIPKDTFIILYMYYIFIILYIYYIISSL